MTIILGRIKSKTIYLNIDLRIFFPENIIANIKIHWQESNAQYVISDKRYLELERSFWALKEREVGGITQQ
jgi:hypothetical protein